MKGKLIVSMLVACMPWLAMAQSSDDLYFIPKKEKKVEAKERVGIVPRKVMNETVNELPAGTRLVVKDVNGRTRDVDEYNRRYTSKDNTFSYQNDTLYVTEKPYGERGEWVNGFDGSESDYEYAMRLVRFRSPRYAIPVSSPLYWDVVYGAYPSWEWNVYDDGLYAYAFPTMSNRLWWDWRWSSGFYGPGWGFSFGWSAPWYYNSWYSPYWYGGYYAGYWGPGWHHHYPHYGWCDSYYSPSYNYNNRRAESGFAHRGGSYSSSHRDYIGSRSDRTVVSTRDRNGRTGGRVIRSSGDVSRGSHNSNAVRSRNGIYSRPTQSSDRSNRVYTRPSSTRGNSYQSDRYNSRSRSNGYKSDRYENRSRSRDNSYKFSGGSSSRRYSSGGSFRSSGGGGSRIGSGSSGRSGGGAHRR